MPGQIRSDLWVSAFVRRHNDIGRVCVVARRGDPIAGQIVVAIDHLNGTVSLYMPAPSVLRQDDDPDRVFAKTLDRVTPDKVADRIRREAEFDTDLWVVDLEMRTGEPGLTVVG